MPQLPNVFDDNDEPLAHAVRTRGSRGAAVVAAAIVLFVVAAVAKPWGAAPAGGGPSPSARSSSQRVAAATATPRPASPPNPCNLGSILVSPGGEQPPSIALPPIPLARTGRVALISPGTVDTNVGGTHQLVVVAGSTGARSVATVMTGGPVESGWASVRAWSSDGSMLIVAAGYSSPSSAVGNCSDLFLVQADGSRVERLTHNAPGQEAVGAVFLPGGRSMAFLEVDLTDSPRLDVAIRIVPFASSPTAIWPVACPLPPSAGYDFDGMLSASPDGSILALRCADGMTTFDVASRTSRRILPLAIAGEPAAVGWASDGSEVAAVEDPVRTGTRKLDIVRARRSGPTATAATDAEAWDGTPAQAAISPDGTHAVAQACLVTGIPHNCQEDVFSIDLAAGTKTLLFARQPMLAATQIRWLPDGSGVAISDGGDGSLLVAANGSGRPIASRLPIDALWWVPRGPR